MRAGRRLPNSRSYLSFLKIVSKIEAHLNGFGLAVILVIAIDIHFQLTTITFNQPTPLLE